MRTPFSSVAGTKVFVQESMTKHTSFHLGGNARYFVKVFSLRALKKLLHIIEKKKMRYCIIGAGSNILVSDRGYPGVIIKLYGVFRKVRRNNGMFWCGSGLWIDHFLQRAKAQGYGGAEFLAGIPGTIGGAIKGNAGAFGKSMADIVTSITIMTGHGVIQNLSSRDIGFGYRRTEIHDGVTILTAQLKLNRRNQKDIASGIRKNLIYRNKIQPTGFSAGSYFRNIKPHIAGKLIDACGLKGLRIGDAEVSTKHANFIINRGNARTSDVLRLAKMIKDKVMSTKGILLEEEVKFLK
jgi:UDP-N-acetylmuramate dehydrogenase